MSPCRLLFGLLVLGVIMGGCAKPVDPSARLSATPAVDQVRTASIAAKPAVLVTQPMPSEIFAPRDIAGRTLSVGTTADIVLKRGEVVLTFDDGPRPGKTTAILDTLAEYGVKATFLMLGSAAEANPRLAQSVARAGHTVGSHTYGHVDLADLTRQEAIAEIARGEDAVSAALAGGGQVLSPFFRFPYLSQTGFLRTGLLQSGAVILDVDIDSKDYYRETPQQVVDRTLARLDMRGSGVILFHDIHQRTVDMLPAFLDALAKRGYSVVRLVPRDNSVFGRDLITAGMRDTPSAL
ncbi:Peptidoglycan/xylan/chitin deacetylase, PgdA/CDA1 family [Devosia crocina]|uniref:Chitooligosaccharide deacetylase n=1 Tax=Devosia crocina TaxID=429728 RepID=A0A1I7NEL2_9HYPH|nr:polysaccharide deacetylase family protein [Devosia crocina]SFV33023.1 Peptidoglycan/xylan/chitin deacetylase, PgdA/CDA1 family [Devosia crocina]